MRAIVREMREEEAWSDVILDELEVWGVDRFTDTAVQIKCRIMCTPFGRWPVSREYNRRMQQRFQMVGLATSFSALRLPTEAHADGAAWPPAGAVITGPAGVTPTATSPPGVSAAGERSAAASTDRAAEAPQPAAP